MLHFFLPPNLISRQLTNIQVSYTYAILRVFIDVKNNGGSEVEQAVALLHDTLEDVEGLTEFVIQDELTQMVASYEGKEQDIKDVARNVRVLSKVKGQSNLDYYKYIKQFPVARKVKLADIRDNFRRNHLIVDNDKRLRMMEKYSLGMDILA
jgi:(p)ppGpp synthase/HD superfamily hydrolase